MSMSACFVDFIAWAGRTIHGKGYWQNLRVWCLDQVTEFEAMLEMVFLCCKQNFNCFLCVKYWVSIFGHEGL